MKLDAEKEESQKKLAAFCAEVEQLAAKLQIESCMIVADHGRAKKIWWYGYDDCGEPDCVDCEAQQMENMGHDLLAIASHLLGEHDDDDDDDEVPNTELN